MKCFKYTYDIYYGEGQGIIFAKDKESAREMLETSGEFKYHDGNIKKTKIKEVKIKKGIHDFSWEE